MNINNNFNNFKMPNNNFDNLNNQNKVNDLDNNIMNQDIARKINDFHHKRVDIMDVFDNKRYDERSVKTIDEFGKNRIIEDLRNNNLK